MDQRSLIPGRSCGINLLEFLEKVTQVLDEGQHSEVKFLNFAKAYDKVPRKRLLEKTRAHRVQGETLQYFSG